MNVKRTLLCVGMAISLTSGSAFAGTQERERICLVIGKYAESAAKARVEGMSEKEALGILKPGPKGTPTGDLYVALKQVVSWIHTVYPTPIDARKLVYLKCLNHEFFAYNPKVDT